MKYKAPSSALDPSALVDDEPDEGENDGILPVEVDDAAGWDQDELRADIELAVYGETELTAHF